jgi:phage terminase large subunit-like protein
LQSRKVRPKAKSNLEKTDDPSAELKRLQLEKLRLQLELHEGLPHLHGFPFYKWSREFFESENRMLFLTAGNQISKSSTQIRKAVQWATAKDLWPKLWRTKPLTFWYLYPSLLIANKEAEKKWIPEFLPRGRFKDHPQYGWRAEKDAGLITGFRFNSGVSIIFKSYATNESMLQTGTVWYLAFDEEMPEWLWPELVMRTAATDGYISGVFTPTLSQQFWYDVMEKRGKGERFPQAHKITASLYDSMFYEDGTKSPWTKERITRIINSLPTHDEVQRRVYGRFIMDKKGLKYPSFSREHNVLPAIDVPEDWYWYYGIDSGSGGYDGGHPAAIVGVAVSPDFKKGRVVECWIGTPENVVGEDKHTTAGDILAQYLRMSAGKTVVSARYDFADKDLEVIATRNGVHLEKAEKANEFGEGLLNTLFKNNIISIDEGPKTEALVVELLTLKKSADKKKARDHLADATRYCVTAVPWDTSGISGVFEKKVEPPKTTSTDRVLYRPIEYVEKREMFDEQFREINELYGASE